MERNIIFTIAYLWAHLYENPYTLRYNFSFIIYSDRSIRHFSTTAVTNIT